jgi:hypothetical protein
MKPALSVLLPALKGYASVAPAIAAWDAQTCRDQLELVVLCPSGLGPAPGSPAHGHVVIDTGRADFHEARAIGITRASADFIMLAEDHCLPDPDWAAAILPRLKEGWDGVVSALRPGTRTGAWPEASFLLGYGQWMEPIASGPTDVMCGWNGTLRRDLLLAQGENLDSDLRVGAFLVRRLQQQGARYVLESRARLRHFDLPGVSREISLLFLVGLGFGAMRSRRWSWPARVVYPLLFPAIAAAHARRAVVHYVRARGTVRPMALPAAGVLALSWGLGEALGAIVGVRAVTPHLWRTEVKPVPAEVVAASDQFERLHRV